MDDQTSNYPPVNLQTGLMVVREAPPNWQLPGNTRLEPGAVSTEQLKHQYANEWLAIQVTNRDRVGTPIAGRLLVHANDADAVWQQVAGKPGQFYVFYAGEILKDMAVIFRV